MKVTIFGSARPNPGEPAYEEALQLGKLLATAGHTVLTGGYMGTMEAVSRGAAEAGGHVIGVTCEEIERWRRRSANPWVLEEWRRPTLMERLDTLITSADAALALPGGPGTFTEILTFWNRLLIQSISLRPLILIGKAWKVVFDTYYREMGNAVSEQEKSLLTFAGDIHQAIAMLPNQKH